MGGPIGLIEDGDRIAIDAAAKRLDLLVDEETMAARKKSWTRPKSNVTRGILAKYRAQVLSASEGAITVAPAWDE